MPCSSMKLLLDEKLLLLVMVVVLSWERWRHEALGMLQA